jgi:hypothetical protein
MSGFYCVSVGPKVLRLIAALPDGALRAKTAVGNTPGAVATFYPGRMPAEGEAVEDFAQQYREDFCERLADDFLKLHDIDLPDETTKNERPSGLRMARVVGGEEN